MDSLLILIFIFFSFLFTSRIAGKLARLYISTILVWWFLPIIISITNPFGLYPVSLETYLIVLIGSFFFVIGFVFTKQRNKVYSKYVLLDRIEDLFNKRIFLVLYFIGLVFIGSLGVVQWKLVEMQGGMGNLKIDFFELIFNRNSTLFFIYQILLVPMFYILSMITAVYLINGVLSKKVLLMLLYVIIFSYVGGKRGYFAIFLQYFIIAYIIRISIQKYNHLKKIPIGKLGIIAIIILIGAAYMTAAGKAQDTSKKDVITEALSENAENLIIYQIGPYRALEYAINNDYLNKYGAYTYGRSSLGGIIDYYGCSILKMVGINITQSRALSMSPLQENSINVGTFREWNFSYTSFYYFLFDFGWVGIVIFPLLFGMFVRFSINLFETTRTIGSLCLIGYLFIACLQFQASWFYIQLYALPIILICFIMARIELRNRALNDLKRNEC